MEKIYLLKSGKNAEGSNAEFAFVNYVDARRKAMELVNKKNLELDIVYEDELRFRVMSFLKEYKKDTWANEFDYIKIDLVNVL